LYHITKMDQPIPPMVNDGNNHISPQNRCSNIIIRYALHIIGSGCLLILVIILIFLTVSYSKKSESIQNTIINNLITSHVDNETNISSSSLNIIISSSIATNISASLLNIL